MTWIDTTALRRDACRILRDAGWTIEHIAIVINRPTDYVDRRLAPPREEKPYFLQLPPGFADDDPFEPGRWLGNRAGRGTIEKIRRWIGADVPKAEP
jgi:hypothetical protein